MEPLSRIKGKAKTAFKKIAQYPVARYAMAAILPIRLKSFPFSSKEHKRAWAANILLWVAAQIGGAPLLPSLEDVAKERAISPETIAMLDPYLDVRVEDKSFGGYLHAAMLAPGIYGPLSYLMKRQTSDGYAYRSHFLLPPLFSDSIGKKIGGACIINLQDALEKLDNPPPVKFENFPMASEYVAYGAIFHETRHCAKDQPDNPYHEIEANYYATLALKEKFGERAVLFYQMAFMSIPEYDHTLYAEFIETGKPLPPVEMLEQASADAWDAFKSLGLPKLPDQVKSAVNANLEASLKLEHDSEAYKALAPLAKRRLLHIYGQILAAEMQGATYKILKGDSILLYKVTPSQEPQPRQQQKRNRPVMTPGT